MTPMVQQHAGTEQGMAAGFMFAAADRAVDRAASIALSQRVMEEIAIIDNTLGQLRLQHGAEAEESVTHLLMTRSALFTSLRDVQYAKHPRELRHIASSVDVSIRHSAEARAAAPIHEETTQTRARKLIQTVAVPGAGMVALKFAGKPLGLLDYRQALGMLHARGQALVREFTASLETHAAVALQHDLDITASQQTQATLLQHARDAYMRDQPVEAATHISEAATLGLREAERVREIQPNDVTGTLVEKAQENAMQAARHAVDQMQVDARRDCTQQGKTGQELEACTVDASALRIASMRMRMIRVQMQVETPQEEAEARTDRIIRSIAPQDQPLLLGQERAQQQARDAAVQWRLTVTDVTMTQALFAPAETPLQLPAEIPPVQAY